MSPRLLTPAALTASERHAFEAWRRAWSHHADHATDGLTLDLPAPTQPPGAWCSQHVPEPPTVGPHVTSWQYDMGDPNNRFPRLGMPNVREFSELEVGWNDYRLRTAIYEPLRFEAEGGEDLWRDFVSEGSREALVEAREEDRRTDEGDLNVIIDTTTPEKREVEREIVVDHAEDERRHEGPSWRGLNMSPREVLWPSSWVASVKGPRIRATGEPQRQPSRLLWEPSEPEHIAENKRRVTRETFANWRDTRIGRDLLVPLDVIGAPFAYMSNAEHIDVSRGWPGWKTLQVNAGRLAWRGVRQEWQHLGVVSLVVSGPPLGILAPPRRVSPLRLLRVPSVLRVQRMAEDLVVIWNRAKRFAPWLRLGDNRGKWEWWWKDGASLYRTFTEAYTCVFCGARWLTQSPLVYPESTGTRLACCAVFKCSLPPVPRRGWQRQRQNQKYGITLPPSKMLLGHQLPEQQQAIKHDKLMEEMRTYGFDRSARRQKWEVTWRRQRRSRSSPQ
jgi:hypothetical protein